MSTPTESTTTESTTTVSAIKRTLGGNLREYGIIGALMVIVLLFQVLTHGKLLQPNNVASLVQQNAYVMILAIGMVIVIVAGHIDLSVGSVVAFVGGVVALLMKDMGLPWLVAVIVGILLGALVGAWQGYWVAYVGIPAFIVTLAGMLIFRGLAIILVGVTVSGFPDPFVQISNGSLPNALGFLANRDVVTLALGAITIAALVFSQVRARRSLIKHELTPSRSGPSSASWWSSHCSSARSPGSCQAVGAGHRPCFSSSGCSSSPTDS